MGRIIETLHRQWTMLSKLPHHPQRISTRKLKEQLADESFDVDIRTIQRDLEKLSCHFPIINDQEGRRYYWYWMEGATVLDLPGMSPATAMTFTLAKSYLIPLLPRAVLELLTPYFERATQVLGTSTHTELHDWPEKVAVIERGPKLKSPAIDSKIQQTVYQAVLEEKAFTANYRARGSDKETEYQVHPLGVVYRQGVIYLVCTLWQYQDIKQLALHRFTSVKMVDIPYHQQEPNAFSRYVKQQHGFAYPLSEASIALKALFSPCTAEHLYETPLTDDQILSEQADNRVLLEATADDTWELRWWLQGFADKVEVLEPIELREYFSASSKRLHTLYSCHPS